MTWSAISSEQPSPRRLLEAWSRHAMECLLELGLCLQTAAYCVHLLFCKNRVLVALLLRQAQSLLGLQQ